MNLYELTIHEAHNLLKSREISSQELTKSVLDRVETEGVAPTSHAISLTNAFREDKVKEHLDRNKALANAPEKEDGNFVVPKVIG